MDSSLKPVRCTINIRATSDKIKDIIHCIADLTTFSTAAQMNKSSLILYMFATNFQNLENCYSKVALMSRQNRYFYGKHDI